MNILGINAYHADAAACLICDGRLITAAEEERFRRQKHWAGFPKMAIAYCLSEGGLSLRDIDCVAINRNNRANLVRKCVYLFAGRPSPRLLLEKLRNRAKSTAVEQELAKAFPQDRFIGTVEYVEHHLAHLASAFYASPFREAAAVSIDGFGDFASAAWGFGEDTVLSLDGRMLFPHSLGIFYQAMTQYIGFPQYGDEYKLMGLAAYGTPSLISSVRPLVSLQSDGTFRLNLRFFRHHREAVVYEWNGGQPVCGDLFSSELESALGPRRKPDEALTDRHRDLAFATQAVFEHAFFHLLNTLYVRYGSDALVLAGGCAYNSVANGKIHHRTPFKRSYLQSAAGDAGGAIGAAYAVWHNSGGQRSEPMMHAYWGPGYSDEELAACAAAQKKELAAQNCRIFRQSEDEEEVIKTVASAIAEGKVVGWFQGRMEWGPRALGNRSILGDPRRANMKEILNLKIKRRESFRPFAPSILREAIGDWFESDEDVPFMLQVFSIRPERRHQIPAVTHVDGTGRLQTVTVDTNPRYYALIESFRRLTGVPMLLNTSFNENEPVVCRPKEALDCFVRTKMDMLVLGLTVVMREEDGRFFSGSAPKHRLHELS
jgi:carbamoyltransferase